MLEKFRSSIVYKICGIVCGILSLLALFIYKSAPNIAHDSAALLIFPIALIIIVLLLLDAFIFILLTIITIISVYCFDDDDDDNNKMNKNKNYRTNLLADIGYIFTICSMFYAIFTYLK